MPVRDYPYYPVNCEFCLRHPETWKREVNPADQHRGERERIAFGRIHGWSAIPSNSVVGEGRLLESPRDGTRSRLLPARGDGDGGVWIWL